MKATRAICAAASAAIALALAGCSPSVGTFSNSLGGTQATETAAMSAESTTLKSQNNVGLSVSAISATAINNADKQVIYLDFANSDVIDSSTIASSVFFYPLSDAADAYSRYKRGDALSYTSSVQGSRVYFTIDASKSSALVELYIDASKLTGNGGAKKLNLDSNTTYGESSDCYVNYLSVAQVGTTVPTAVSTGERVYPQRKVAVAASTGSIFGSSAVKAVATYTGTSVFAFTAFDSHNVADPAATKANVKFDSGAFTAYKNVDGVWTAQSGISPSYDSATGNTTLSGFSPAAGESYKFVLDLYNVIESKAINDFTHRASYRSDITDPVADSAEARYVVRYYTFTKGAVATQTFTSSVPSDSVAGAKSVNLTVSGTTPIDMDTIKSASFKVRLTGGTFLNGSAIPANYFVSYTTQTLTTTLYDSTNGNAVTQFKVLLPANIKTASGQIEIAPSVLSVKSSTDAQTLISFGDPSNRAYDGWGVIPNVSF
jgi:hypothetical protein